MHETSLNHSSCFSALMVKTSKSRLPMDAAQTDPVEVAADAVSAVETDAEVAVDTAVVVTDAEAAVDTEVTGVEVVADMEVLCPKC